MLDDRFYMRSQPQHWSGRPVWLILVILNVAIYAAQLILDLASPELNARIFVYTALSLPGLSHFFVWQLVTFQFLHGGLLHILLNCAMLWMFGRAVEYQVGRSRFFWLYILSGIAGGLLQMLCSLMFPTHFGTGPVVGASAGVFGVIAAFAVLNAEQFITTLLAFIIPVTMKAKYLLAVEVVISLFGMLERRSGVAHAAHLGGIIGAIIFVKWVVLGHTSGFRWPALPAMPWKKRELVGARTKSKGWVKAERPEPEELPPAEFISKEVDPILDKISAHGIHSLTERERKILEAARARMAKR